MKMTITGADKLVAALLKASKEVSKELRKGMKEALTEVQEQAVKDSQYTSRSGNLDRNIQDPNNLEVSPSGTKGKITVHNTTNVPYAYIQHEGGTITAKNSKYLHFNVEGKWVKTKQVTLKPKKYLTRAMKTMRKKVIEILNESVNTAIKKAGL